MEKNLAPIEQKTVVFYDDEIVAVRMADGAVYVPIRPICDLLGIDSAAQRRRINRDAVLSDEAQSCDVVTASQSQSPQRRAMFSLPLEFLNGWLFGVNANRVKPELKERLIRYQRECYKVLHEAFKERRLTADPTFEELIKRDTPEVQAYKMAMAIASMARQQILIKAQVSSNVERIEALESKLSDPERLISAEQAMHVSQAVKTIALELGKRSGRNEFAGVYGELYRRFRIPSYRELPAAQYDQAMGFLRQWYQTVTDDGSVPF